MSRTVFCKKYQKELEGLDAPPYPGPKGQELFDSVSKQAWMDWQTHQTMLINEKQLSLVDPQGMLLKQDRHKLEKNLEEEKEKRLALERTVRELAARFEKALPALQGS